MSNFITSEGTVDRDAAEGWIDSVGRDCLTDEAILWFLGLSLKSKLSFMAMHWNISRSNAQQAQTLLYKMCNEDNSKAVAGHKGFDLF